MRAAVAWTQNALALDIESRAVGVDQFIVINRDGVRLSQRRVTTEQTESPLEWVKWTHERLNIPIHVGLLMREDFHGNIEGAYLLLDGGRSNPSTIHPFPVEDLMDGRDLIRGDSRIMSVGRIEVPREDREHGTLIAEVATYLQRRLKGGVHAIQLD